MKELQKYYARKDGNLHSATIDCERKCIAVYFAHEAEAAFAAEIASLKQQHAEEMERLKAETADGIQGFARANYEMRKQAERYEKLRRLNPQQFLEIWKTNLMGPRFDDLVDQLP